MRYAIIVGLAVGLVLPSLASAGSAANPASTVGRENFGFAFEIENQVKNVDRDQTASKRWLGKVIWGATDRLDIYAKLGASDLKIGTDDQVFEGKRGMTWGGGGRLLIGTIEQPNLAAYLDAQMISFHTAADFRGVGDAGPYRAYERYKWNELQFSLFGIWRHEVFAPYLGVGVTHLFGNVKKEVYVNEVRRDDLDQAYDFAEDAIPEIILGMDLDLGGTGRLSGEIRYDLDEENISFFVGASELLRVK